MTKYTKVTKIQNMNYETYINNMIKNSSFLFKLFEIFQNVESLLALLVEFEFVVFDCIWEHGLKKK